MIYDAVMSIIIPLVFMADDKEVRRVTVPVGYSMPSAENFIGRMIHEVMFSETLLKKKMFKFDKAISYVPGSDPVVIMGDAFATVFECAALARAGASSASILKKAHTELASLDAVDGSRHTPAESKVLADTVMVIKYYLHSF